MPLSVAPAVTLAACALPQRSPKPIRMLLTWYVSIAFPLGLMATTRAAECESCDHRSSQCATPFIPLSEMGCTSNDTLDLTVGSDSLPGAMSHCQCEDCNSTRFENQFSDAKSRCEGYQPQWVASVRLLAFTRVTPSPGVLISDSTNPIRQINRDAFQFGWEPGIDISMRRINWNESSFELRFMGVDSLVATTSTIAGATAEIHAAVPVFVGDISSVEATYQSDLYGLEANWQFVTYCPFQYIAGVRYVGLNERLNTELSSPTAPVTYRTTTHNDLYGVQVGITSIPDMPLFDCRWLTWSAKIGLYGNDAKQTSTLTGVVGQRTDSPADTAAFAGEFKFGLDIPLTHCIRLSGGYNLFLLEQVAVATDQLQATNFFTSTGRNDQGNAFFHGGSVAITLQF